MPVAVRELELVLENPTSQMGIHTTSTCPPWAFCPDETWGVVNVKLRDGMEKTYRWIYDQMTKK